MTALNIENARFNMIEQQIRPCDVIDPVILSTFFQLKRETFVGNMYQSLAFADTCLPLNEVSHMWTPSLEGRILQALAIKPTDRILEIGTGSGYLTACLAALGQSVLSIEHDSSLATVAQTRLVHMNNVQVQVATVPVAGADEYAEQGPFDVIVFGAAVPYLADFWQQQLTLGGRLIATVGSAPNMLVTRVERLDAVYYRTEGLFETEMEMLHSSVAQPAFVF